MNHSSTTNFVRVGGRLVIDLLNTVGARDGARLELLDHPEDLPVWADVAGVPYAREIGIRSDAELDELRAFREVLREGLQRWREGDPASSELIARLNRELARDPRHVSLRMDDGALGTEMVSTGDPLDRLYADVAASLAMMLGRDDRSRYRSCANDTCTFTFYDDSKPGTRRWCSMELCGGRAKARAFRLRHGVGRS
ncbi:MAG: CGNR zinc finger domain-containing protein [Gemmatimonadales bacterium]|jgi:predicted RNA-binding Zn ribbon-like protein